MPSLLIQHSVPDFDAWKAMFDSDPVDRKGSGVTRYRVARSLGTPTTVSIELELNTIEEAERLHEKLRTLWSGPASAIVQDPRMQIVETVEEVTL
ncbi:MAG: hypothetical protein WAW17_02130 [Rhodococcus sp. (in: high G+C Gram-positive bacteria)]